MAGGRQTLSAGQATDGRHIHQARTGNHRSGERRQIRPGGKLVMHPAQTGTQLVVDEKEIVSSQTVMNRQFVGEILHIGQALHGRRFFENVEETHRDPVVLAVWQAW